MACRSDLLSPVPLDPARWQRIAALFEAALEQPDTGRDRFVRETAAADTALRDAVLRMLGHDAETQVFDHSVDDLAAAVFGDSEEPEPVLAPGTRLADYEIEGVLGRGGMGVVYRARDVRLNRAAALKFLPPSAVHDGGESRIETEARAASALDHPNIATVYHVGTTPDGRAFIAMACYEGETLAARLDRGPLPSADAVRIASDVASALAAAHQRGIVHRDVKPANIFLTSAGITKLLDFGIATGAGETPGVSTPGTPLYMSPEQARSTPSSPRSDVWSLGAVLYEMLAGVPPFQGETRADLRARKAGSPAPLPPDPGISDGLRAMLERALSPEPDDRHADAGALLSDLNTLRPTGSPTTGRVARRRALLVSGLALIALMAWYFLRPGSTSPTAEPVSANVVAVFPFRVQGSPAFAYLGEGMVDLLSADFDGVAQLRTVDPRAIRAGSDSTVADVRQAARVARRLGAGRYILGNIIEANGHLRATATLYDQAGRRESSAEAEAASEEGIFRLVDRLAGQLLARQAAGSGEAVRVLAASTTTSLSALKAFLEGEQHLRHGRFESATASYEQAVSLDTSFALAYYGIANAGWWSERSTRVRAPAARALSDSASLPRTVRMQLQGLLARLDGDFDRAEEIYRQLIALAPEEPDAWFGLADVLHHFNPVRGRSLDEAVPYFERALSLQGDNMSVRLHLANIAARHRQYARHDSLIADLPANAGFSRYVRLTGAFANGDSAAQLAALHEFNGAEARVVGEALHYVVRLSHNPAGGFRLIELLERPNRPGADRALARLYRAGLELTLGRWGLAVRDLETADSMGNPDALPSLALWSLAPFVPARPEQWRGIRGRLERRERSHLLLEDRAASRYLRGMLTARLGDPVAAGRLADSLDAAGAPRDTAHAHNFALAIRAESALLAGDSGRALSLLEQIHPTASMYLLQQAVYGQAYERFQRAELLYAAGRMDEAAGWFRGETEASRLESIYDAPAYFQLARLRQRIGDTAGWARQDGWFRELWSNADPEVIMWARGPGRG